MKSKIFLSLFYIFLISLYGYSDNSVTSLYINTIKDVSGYKGTWDIGEGFTGILIKELKKLGRYNLIYPWDETDTGNCYSITGRIKKYSLRLIEVSSPKLAGYQNIKAEIDVIITLQDKNNKIYSFEKKCIRKKTLAGLTLFGGPKGTGEIKKYISSIYNSKMDSFKFQNSIMSDVIDKIIENTIVEISLHIFDVPAGIKGEIISVRDNIVNIDLGYKNSIKQNNIFTVYTRPEKIIHPRTNKVIGYEKKVEIGKIKVISVENEELSKGEIIEGKNKIKKGDLIVMQ